MKGIAILPSSVTDAKPGLEEMLRYWHKDVGRYHDGDPDLPRLIAEVVRAAQDARGTGNKPKAQYWQVDKLGRLGQALGALAEHVEVSR